MVKKESKTRKVMLCLTRELDKKIVEEAKKVFGDRQGYYSMYVEMVMRNHLHLGQPLVEET